MFQRTRSRGPSATGGETPATGAASSVLAAARRLEPTRRVLAICMLLALVLHLPALPTRLSAWLDLLGDETRSDDDDPVDAESFVPIDLDLEGLEAPGEPGGQPGGEPRGPSAGATEGDVFDPAPSHSAVAPPAPPPAPPPTPAPTPVDPPPPPPPPAEPSIAMDAGVPDAAPDDDPYETDAGPEDAGPARVTDLSDAGAPPSVATDPSGPADAGPPVASSKPDAGPRIVRLDPDEQTKVTRGLTAAPNVQVLLVGKQLRTHPVGKELGPLLREIPQWKGFFEGTGIDPVADLDHIQITGPELRKSGQIVSVLEFAGPPERIRGAVEAIVKRSKGEWLTGTTYPTARAKVDKAERLFVLLPTRRILAVLPGKDEAKIDAVGKVPSYPADLPFAIQISMVTPHRAFRSIEALRIPESIKKMRLRAYPHGAGGGKLELEFLDESAATAKESAVVLSEQWQKLQTAAIAFFLLLEDMDFKVEGDTITGTTTFTKAQLEKILARARTSFTPSKGRGDPKKKDPRPTP